jgi:hypothetical protein
MEQRKAAPVELLEFRCGRVRSDALYCVCISLLTRSAY